VSIILIIINNNNSNTVTADNCYCVSTDAVWHGCLCIVIHLM